jgi:hypothetical protein
MTHMTVAPGRLLDTLVLLWIMPPLGFLLTVTQASNLRYLYANHTLAAVLLAAIVLRCQMRGPSTRLALRLLLVGVAAMAFISIEWIHFLAGRPTIDGLTDMRMIVYSPLYGSFLLFVLYGIYLALLEPAQLQRHLRFFVGMMSWFHALFLVYWVLLAARWIPAIPRTDLLHSNSVAYGGLVLLCILLLYRERALRDGHSHVIFVALMAVNVGVILVNQTRGAIIALCAVMLYLMARGMGRDRRAVLKKLMLGTVIAIGALVLLAEGSAMIKLIGQDVASLDALLQQITAAYESGEASVRVSTDLVSDESSLSAFSRIGSNYYSFLSMVDNPTLGIGQAQAYAIDVMGSGVHSLHFLVANATGLLGLVLFAASLMALAAVQPIMVTSRWLVILTLCFGYILVFINAVPLYFAMVLVALGGQRFNDLRRAARASGRRSPGAVVSARRDFLPQ